MNPGPEEPALFDLPLVPPAGSAEPPHDDLAGRRGRTRASKPESLPLFEDDELQPAEPRPRSAAGFAPLPRREEASSDRASGPRPVPVPLPAADAPLSRLAPTARLGSRLRAGIGDLVVLAAVGAVATLGAGALGGALGPRELPALAAFLLAFSFLYCVVSLAFWGQTPGMSWGGLVARSDETEPLSFGQTALRWLGHWLTWALLGLPALLAAGSRSGRSLADRLSGSETYDLNPRG